MRKSKLCIRDYKPSEFSIFIGSPSPSVGPCNADRSNQILIDFVHVLRVVHAYHITHRAKKDNNGTRRTVMDWGYRVLANRIGSLATEWGSKLTRLVSQLAGESNPQGHSLGGVSFN